MKRSLQTAEELKREYFTSLAGTYHKSVVHSDDEHGLALQHISVFIEALKLTSVLDVGCGTGRGIKYMLDRFPNLKARGMEPMPAMIEAAIAEGVPEDLIIEGCAEDIPYGDSSFDAVCAFGVMHHVPDSSSVIKELMRVARKAIFISDSNRFGQGPLFARLIKLGSWQMGLWPMTDFVKTRGKGYTISEGDGVSYSYSVFDNYKQLAKWADAIIAIPTSQDRRTGHHMANPTLTAGHVLMCAIKN